MFDGFGKSGTDGGCKRQGQPVGEARGEIRFVQDDRNPVQPGPDGYRKRDKTPFGEDHLGPEILQ